MEHVAPSSLAQLPSPALTARLYEICKAERGLLVEFLAYLAELDRRKLYVELGFSSTFAFLTDHLGFTRSAAFRRTTAARLLARFPIVSNYLGDGRLCLTTLVELRDVLEEPRLGEILDRAAGRTEEQVRELVALLRPRPAPMDLLRRLPEPRSAQPAPIGAGSALVAPARAEPTPVGAGPALVPPAPVRPAPRIEPISEALRVLRMTVGREFVADLESVRAALSHQIPMGTWRRCSTRAYDACCSTASAGDAAREKHADSRVGQRSAQPAAATFPLRFGTRSGVGTKGAAPSWGRMAIGAAPRTSSSSTTYNPSPRAVHRR